MKKTLILTIFVLAQTLVFGAPKAAVTPAQQLVNRLQKIQKKGYMYGHQDDTFYGITWNWDKDRSDTYELVGDYPGVMGFDLGGIELDNAKNLDSVPFELMREEIRKHHERGGVITISWHPRNPLLGTTAWIEKDTTAYNEAVAALKKVHHPELIDKLDNPKHTVRSIIIGGKAHGKFQLWLQRVSTFLASLKDSKGNQIPVIFRPWHENSGSWFWWGTANCSEAEYIALWNTTQDYINATKTTNGTLKDYIVWSYSPSYGGKWTEQLYLSRYPGDERVQLLGEDAYQWGTEEAFKSMLDYNLSLLASIAKQHGKLLAVTECGYQNSPDATWWTRVFKPIIEKYPVCYFLPWRNYSKEHFGASKDAKTADDFKVWAKTKKFLFVQDIKKVK